MFFCSPMSRSLKNSVQLLPLQPLCQNCISYWSPTSQKFATFFFLKLKIQHTNKPCLFIGAFVLSDQRPAVWERIDLESLHCCFSNSLTYDVCIDAELCSDFADNQDGSDWRDDDEKLPGHENLTEKDIELFRHIQELALQVGCATASSPLSSCLGGTCEAGIRSAGSFIIFLF